MAKLEKQFLVEIGVEEIPSQYLEGIRRSFQDRMAAGLKAERLLFDGLTAEATPRRFVVSGRVSAEQTVEEEWVRGPSYQACYRNGEPTPALNGFLGRVGLTRDQVSFEGEGPKAYLMARVEKPVKLTQEVLPDVVRQAFEGVPVPRSMRWGEGDEKFLRPVRWALLALDDQMLAFKVFGVASGAVSYGNRTDHPEPFPVGSVDDYRRGLAEAGVMLSAQDRLKTILDVGQRLAGDIGGKLQYDPLLLEEVPNLVEWPTPFVGSFPAEYLAIPEPILVTSMRVHQRYFPIVDSASGRLMPAFLAVRNGVGRDLSGVRHGNEKVLRARLADAQYFYQGDLAHRLEDFRSGLDRVTVHAKLGTYGDKIDRMRTILGAVGGWWNRQAPVLRAIELYKCDLLTQVVQEFPELQGEIGALYAARDQEDREVVSAIADQYRPGFQGDRVPEREVGQIVALLDRIESVLSSLSAGIRPTGSEDPYGLRRAALGIGRIAAETPVMGLHTVREILERASDGLGIPQEISDEAYRLVRSRMETFLSEERSLEEVRAVLALDFPWHLLERRLHLLKMVHDEPGFVAFQAAFKRMRRVSAEAEPTVLSGYEGSPETALLGTLASLEHVPEEETERWWQGVQEATLAVNRFFDEVLVMDPDLTVRQRRLALMARGVRVYARYFDPEELS